MTYRSDHHCYPLSSLHHGKKCVKSGNNVISARKYRKPISFTKTGRCLFLRLKSPPRNNITNFFYFKINISYSFNQSCVTNTVSKFFLRRVVIFPGTRCVTRNRVFITRGYPGYPFSLTKNIYKIYIYFFWFRFRHQPMAITQFNF